MGRIKLVLIIIISTIGLVEAQVNRYMVFFKDKSGTPFNVSTPLNFLSQRAIDRRQNQNIAVVEQDLPVVPSYVTQVQGTGAKVLYKTKWMNGVLVEATDAQKTALELLACVSSVKKVAPGGRPAPSGRVRSSGKFKEIEETAVSTDTQLGMLSVNTMHNKGLHGEGMFIAVLDAGFPGANTSSFFEHVFSEGRFDAVTSYDFVSGGSNVFRQHTHGTNVWSIIGAYKQDQFVGGAYKAKFVLFITEHQPTEYKVEEYNWLAAAERADSVGVDIINSSLGYRIFDDPTMNYAASDLNGSAAVITLAAEIAASKGIAVVVSAGNEGNNTPTTIGAPADAEHVLTVGAVTSSRMISSFSSIGPTADNRIKPDVVALGTGVSIISSSGTISSGNGTSFSCPLMASFVAGLWQEFPDLTVSQLFDLVRSMGHQAASPNNFLGHGIPDYYNDPPVANNQNATVEIDLAKSIVLSANDAEQNSLTYAVLSIPSHGSLSGAAPNLLYTPSTGFTGSDNFTFMVNDGTTDSNIATVSIIVGVVTSSPPPIETIVNIFPNPTSQVATIELQGSKSYADLKWTLLDSRGAEHVIQLMPSGENKFNLDLSDKKAGLYLLRCQQGSRYATYKILKVE